MSLYQVGFAVAALTFAVFVYIWQEMPSEIHVWAKSMAEEIDENRSKFAAMNKSAFILGYTGESGKALLRELVDSHLFTKIVLVGRREVKFDDEAFQQLEQKVIDFDKIEEYQEAFTGLDVGFNCLGTTRGKAGKEGFYKVDHDYVINSAKVAKAAGCSHFHLVSSAGANKNSMFLYPKTKGQAEEEIAALGFDRFSIYRPAVLMCDREESRRGEAVMRTMLKPMAYAFPTFVTTPTTTLAKAMANSAVSSSTQAVEILDNKAIHHLSGELREKKEQKKKNKKSGKKDAEPSTE